MRAGKRVRRCDFGRRVRMTDGFAILVPVPSEDAADGFAVRLCCAECGGLSPLIRVRPGSTLTEAVIQATDSAVIDEGWTIRDAGDLLFGRMICFDCREASFDFGRFKG